MRSLAVVLLSLTAAAVQETPTYPIHFARNLTVGRTYTLTADGSLRAVMKSGDEAKIQEFAVHFEGQAKVGLVDKQGEAYRIEFTVAKFIRTAGGKTSEVLPPGTVIVADGSREEKYSLKEGAMDDDARQAFSIVDATRTPKSVRDEDAFGSKQSRSVGDSWPIDAPLAAQHAQSIFGLFVPAAQLSGTTHFVSIDKFAGAECARLETEMASDEKLGSGRTAKDASYRAHFKGCFPLSGAVGSFKKATTCAPRREALPRANHTPKWTSTRSTRQRGSRTISPLTLPRRA